MAVTACASVKGSAPVPSHTASINSTPPIVRGSTAAAINAAVFFAGSGFPEASVPSVTVIRPVVGFTEADIAVSGVAAMTTSAVNICPALPAVLDVTVTNPFAVSGSPSINFPYFSDIVFSSTLNPSKGGNRD